MSISGGLVGSYSQLGRTMVLVDDQGNELVGVITENIHMLDAKPGEDIRQGKTAVTDEGIVIGSAVIPNYETYTGVYVISNNNDFILPLPNGYDYKKLQAIICAFNTSLSNSVGTEKVVIDGQVFNVQSTNALSTVVVDTEQKAINFGITNNSGNMSLIRYFMYRELY